MSDLFLPGAHFITPEVPMTAPELSIAFALSAVPEKQVTHAALTLTGLGLYRAFVNGQRVGSAYLTPGFNDYDAYVRCQTYEVTPLLQAQNRLAVVLGNGWYKGRFGVERADNEAFGAAEGCFGTRHLLRAQLVLTHADGSQTLVNTDEAWQATPSVIGENSIYDGEMRNDLRGDLGGETRGDLRDEMRGDLGGEMRGDLRDDKPRTAAGKAAAPARCICADTPALLQACEADTTPPIVQILTRKPVLLVSPKGENILDFGQNMVGFVRFVNRLPAGERMVLDYGEVLQNGCFYRDNLRSAKARYEYISGGCVGDAAARYALQTDAGKSQTDAGKSQQGTPQKDTTQSDAGKSQTDATQQDAPQEIEPYFTFYGFRYVRVSGAQRVKPDDFTGVVLCSQLRETLQVQTDNEKINRLLQNALWGQRGNFIDVPTDCPQRDERLGWTGDAQVFLNTACYHMDCKAFYTKFLRDLRVEQTLYYGGDVPMYCPSLKKSCGAGGPGWADAATIMPWQLYRNYGDKPLLARHYPMMRDYVQTLAARDAAQGDTHILREGFAFGDWLAQDGATPQSFVGGTDTTFVRTIYYYNSTRLAALAAQELGEAHDAAELARRAQIIRAAMLDEFFAPNGRLCVDTQTAYVLALQFGVYRTRQPLLDGMQSRLKRDLYRLKTGFLGTPYLLGVLLENGMVNDAYRLLYNEQFPGWLYAVNLGATTIWERWNSLLPDGSISGTGMNSLNHYAYGSVCEAVYAHMAGLQCGNHGWKTAVIAPKLNYRMRQMQLEFASPAGAYRVEWQLCEDGSISLAVQVPTGASAEVHLPLHPEGVSCTAHAGAHQWNYQPVQAVRRPFTSDTILLDLLQSPAACAVLEQTMPQLLGAARGEESDLVADSPRACVEKLPFLRGAKLDEADALLREIVV